MTSYTSGRSGRRAGTARIKENVVFLCPSLWSASRSPKQNVTRNRNCASVGVNPPCRFKEVVQEASCSPARAGRRGRGHARMAAITRRVALPGRLLSAWRRARRRNCGQARRSRAEAPRRAASSSTGPSKAIPSRIARLLGQLELGSGRSRRPRSSSSGCCSSPSFSSFDLQRPSPLPPGALLAGHLAHRRARAGEARAGEDLEVGGILGGPGERGDARGFLSAECLRVVVVVVAVLRLLVPVAGFRAGVLRDERIRAGGGELDQVPDACVRVRVRVDVSREEKGGLTRRRTRAEHALAREHSSTAASSPTRAARSARCGSHAPTRQPTITRRSGSGSLEASDVLQAADHLARRRDPYFQ